jgi:hypothetical protein
LDTSVYGGCFDEEFEQESRRLFGYVSAGKVVVLASAMVDDELLGAPDQVRGLRAGLAAAQVLDCPLTHEVIELREEYLRAGVLAPKWRGDCTHVALASVHRADVLVSWNFKHLVRFDKVRAFQGVNKILGYPSISIVSPQEVLFEEDI